MGEKATKDANKQVVEVILSEKGKRKCKQTSHLEETRAKIGKYTAINGAAAARRHEHRWEIYLSAL